MSFDNNSGSNMTALEANSDDATVVVAITNYKNESEVAARDRMLQNLENFDTYHLKQDFSYKKKGQSKEFLPKVFMAVEQIASFVLQGIADLGDEWFSVEIADGVENPTITADDIKKLLFLQLEKAGFYRGVSDALKCGLLGSLCVAKVHGKRVSKPTFMTKKTASSTKLVKTKDKVWQLAIDIVSPKDFRPDPNGRELYIVQDIEVDFHEVLADVKSATNPSGIYDKDAVDLLQGDYADMLKKSLAARESGQNVTMSSYRKQVRIMECWGIIINEMGLIVHENVVAALAADKYLIRKPQKNPFWHGQHPFVYAPIVRVPHSVFHKALMDAPVKLNRAQNEIYNLILDSGVMSVFGIKQLRTDWLEDASLVDDGIAPGQTLEVNSSCPPGMKVLERVDTSQMYQEALQVFNLTNSELQQASMTNDLRLGVLPSREVKATEIVESSQSITGMLNGVSKALEEDFLAPVLTKAWMTIAQNLDDFDSEEVKKLLGAKKAALISAMSPEQRFAETVNGLTFKVFGITNTLNKMKDFRRITALLQTISGSEVLTEEFAKEYSFSRLLEQIIKSLDVNTDKIKLTDEERSSGQAGPQAPSTQAPQSGPPGPPQANSPDVQSQIPQAASAASGPAAQSGPIPQTHFPPSRALAGTQNGPKI